VAILTHIHCPSCGETKRVCHGFGDRPAECHECSSKREARARAVHLAGLKALTVEERLALIEEWIYDHKPHVRSHDARF